MEKKVFKRLSYAVLLMLFLCCFSLVSIAASPDLKITESSQQDFYPNGTVITTSGTGYVTIFTPNVNDVLQYTRINLSNVANTNISTHTDTDGQVWNMYRGAVANNTRLFREGDIDTYDIITPLSQLDLMMTFVNYAGGVDMYVNDNVVDRNDDATLSADYNKLGFTFNFTNGGTADMIDVNIDACFQRNTNGTADLFNITEIVSDTAPLAPSTSDSETDGFFECFNWTGNISGGGTVLINVNVTSLGGLNFDEGTTSYDLNEQIDGIFGVVAEANASGSSSAIQAGDLLSNMTVTAKFSRASVRQGVDLALENQPSNPNTWQVRGFFRNPSNSLDYIVHEWRIYEIDPATGAPKATANLTDASPGWGLLTPGTTQYTGWFDTNSAGKPYFSSYFDWEINWTGNESYEIQVKARLDMEDIYTVDISDSKSLDGILLPESGTALGYDPQEIAISDSTTYLADANAPGRNFTIYSVVPALGTYANGTSEQISLTINCSTVTVLANAVNITGNVTINCVDPSGANDGYVEVITADINGTDFGALLAPNDIIYIDYNVSISESLLVGVQFNFTGNSTFTTDSGTPITERYDVTTQAEISATDKRLTAYKELWIPDYNNPTFVNASIVVTAYDKSDGQGGITQVKVLDYVVNGTDFNISEVVVFLNDVPLINGTNLTITRLGTVTLSDGTTQVTAWQYEANLTGQWDGTMYDGDVLTIGYDFNITDEGIYTLPSEIVGLDPATGEEIAASAIGVIKVDLPEKTIPFEITDDELKLVTPVTVGNPATWTKTFTAYNPNAKQVRTTFRTEVFADAVQFYATYYDVFGNKVEEIIEKDGDEVFWQTTVDPLETRVYEIRIMTPPILEVDRKVEVLEKLPDKKVKLKMDTYLRSFAKEDYTGIKMRVPIAYEKILEIKDAFGNKLPYNGGADSISIDVPDMEGESMKTITITYTESYPAIVVTTDKERYKANNPVGMSILVINGGEELSHPFIETEVYDPRMDILHTSVVDIGSLEPLAKTETSQEFLVPMSAPTGMYVANVRFREDFATISQGVANFYVLGKRLANLRTIEVFLIVILGMVLVGLVVRRAKEVNKEE